MFAAASSLNGDKALGPDGFPIAFWTFSWYFVKDEVMGFFVLFLIKKKLWVSSRNYTSGIKDGCL